MNCIMSTTSTDDAIVVLEQTLLRIDEVYVYKIPPAYSSGEHRAETWNLAQPLATCSLHVLRRDSSLLLQFFASRPKMGGPTGATEHYLFCVSHLQYSNNQPSLQLEYWVQAVVDSSRYFAIRISNSIIGDAGKAREAWIGLGFRERYEATNFKMSLQEFQHSIDKERVNASTCTFKDNNTRHDDNDYDGGRGHKDTEVEKMNQTSLSLKQGETIHVHLKLHEKKTPKNHAAGTSTTTTTSTASSCTSSSAFITKKPPPPPPPPPTSQQQDSSIKITNVPINILEDPMDDPEWNDFTSAT